MINKNGKNSHAGWASDRVQNRIKQGLCQCGRKPSKGYKTCDFCREVHKIKILKLKCQLFFIYGQRCNVCGETEENFLTLDHIHNDGSQDRRRKGKSQVHTTWRDAIKNPDTEKYQILCWNCNCAKEKNPEWFAEFQERNM